MNENIQERINKQAEVSKNDILWGKPANDILNGRDNAASVKPIRAIWEMVQNARDVSYNGSNIVLTRGRDSFEFRHDGIPFTNDTLNALILQTSAKSRNDGDQVGQYGTGFLTTHKFGRKFYLSGSLKLVDDDELYYNFPKLVVDRTPDSRQDMAKNLSNQFEEINKWLTDLTYRNNIPSEWTIFSYLQPKEIERKNVEEAFKQAPEIIPYVLCLNDGIKSIKLCDKIADRTILFIRGSKKLESETLRANQYSIPIIIEDSTGERSGTISIQTLESKKVVTTKKGLNKAMVTVILPMLSNRVYKLSNNVAKLFIYLPLVGTESWGINFILHSPLFTCSTDDRNSLRLVVDGQTENDPAKENQKYIEEATEIIFDYIRQYIPQWQDVQYLSLVSFDVTNANKELSDYYNWLQNTWLQKMSGLALVNVQTGEGLVRKKLSDIYVLDIALAKEITERNELLMPFYNVLSCMHKEAVPIPDQLVYWSETFGKWYRKEECTRIVNISNIINYIAEHGMSVISESDLLAICRYLCDSEQLSFFDQNILLTENGSLTNKAEAYKSDIFCNRLRSCIKILLPEHTKRFVKKEFADLIKLPVFSGKDIKEALSSCNETLQTNIKTVSDNAKSLWESPVKVSISTDGLLDIKKRNALLDYCRMAIPRSSTSFQANILNLLQEYYDYDFDFLDEIDSNFYGWRGAIRTLLCNALTEFTILQDSLKKERIEWIREIIKCIYDFPDFNGMLQNYRIYLSQSNEFRYCRELKKDAGIPEKMKDIYNTVISTPEQEVEIRKELFDDKFGNIAITDASWEVVLVGKRIMDEIHKSGKYISEIDTYEHKDIIMDIIKNFDDETNGAIWKTAFETIYKDIPSLLAKLVLSKDNRDPLIKIMKVKDKDRLNKVAEIVYDENLINIWEIGKNAWIAKQNENYDFDKKQELGKYVEDYLRKELQDVLADNELKARVDDVQGGQDIIVSINDKPIYYIEVKSRWVSADSVMMSATQLNRSVEKKDCYSLFAVDMVGFNDENVREHKYPDSMDAFINRIRVLTRIGTLNDEILPTKRDPNEQVHIGGDYKAIIPQRLIERDHIGYKEFIDKVLKVKVVESIRKNTMQI